MEVWKCESSEVRNAEHYVPSLFSKRRETTTTKYQVFESKTISYYSPTEVIMSLKLHLNI